MTEVCDMFFETELSEKLNNELESAGVSVSEALIVKTLAAVEAARITEESEAADSERTKASEENISKLIELAGVRKRSRKALAPVLFRAATVMAACFVLVVGAFALRFSTMRMGKEEAAPMPAAENSSARNGGWYAADANGATAGEDYKYFSETIESTDMEVEIAAADSVDSLHEPIAPATENDWADDAGAVQEESVQESVGLEVSEVQNAVALLTERLAQAESVTLHENKQGIPMYTFIVPHCDVLGFYRVYEDGTVKFGEIPPEGETGTMEAVAGSEDEEFRRAVLEWMKEHGYSF